VTTISTTTQAIVRTPMSRFLWCRRLWDT